MNALITKRVLGVLLIAGGFAVATSVGAQEGKGLAGTWKLDVAASKFSPGPAPKSMTITYTPSGETMKIVVDLAPADGAAQHWEMAGGSDGKDYPVTGNPAADTISMKRIDATHGESTFKKGGKVTSVNSRTLSADGKTLTIVSKGTTVDGKPRTDTQVFTR
jgi:hypothetical protein